MICFKTLAGIDIKVLHIAFVDAFSDYQVKIDLPFWKFDEMLLRRGYVPEKSIGAFEDDLMVGFILNGFREWNGKPTVYDLGTGVIPAYRKQGLTTNMFLNISEQLKADKVNQYLLEVLQPNKAAFELYKKQGFNITREFSCYKNAKAKLLLKKSCETEKLEEISDENWKQFQGFWDFQPSWQNSTESIKALSSAFYCSIVRAGSSIAGYGLIDRKTGDIPQLAVDMAYRGKGIAESIMFDLVNNTNAENAAFINVDYKAEAMKGFLNAKGFENFVDQYEMLLEL